MPTTRRLFGIAEDATAGGSDFDTLTVGAIPDASIFWPVTGGDHEKGIEQIDRNEEVRGRRAATPPRPFRAAPSMTVPVACYRSVAEKALRKTLGGTDVVTGTPPAAQTHTLGSLGYGSVGLPAVHAQIVRDDMNHKMSGAVFERAAFSFPLDGEGTIELELQGLYSKHDVAAAPTAAFTGISEDVMMLRDAQAFLDGSVTAVPDLQGFDFSYTNNTGVRWYAKRNVVSQSLGTVAKVYKLWFPKERKLGAGQDVTFSIQFGNPAPAADLAHDFRQVQKFVFEVVGSPLAAEVVPAAVELLRFTIYSGTYTGGGTDALSARDDITQRWEGSSYWSEADTADIKVEVVNGSSTPLV